MVGGWFVGDFEPSSYKTKDFEVCYKYHSKGEIWDTHYHKKATEINLLVKGSMKINGVTLKEGLIFIIDPFYISTPEFLEDCELVVIKTVSDQNDKYLVKN